MEHGIWNGEYIHEISNENGSLTSLIHLKKENLSQHYLLHSTKKCESDLEKKKKITEEIYTEYKNKNKKKSNGAFDLLYKIYVKLKILALYN